MKVWLLNTLKNKRAYWNKRLLEEAKKNKITLKYVTIEDIEIVITSHGTEKIFYKNKLVKLPDIVFPRNDTSYQMKVIVDYLENNGVFIINNNDARMLAKDKFLSLQKLSMNGLSVPKTILLKWTPNYDFIEQELQFPVIIKKLQGQQWKWIIKVNNKPDFEDFVEILDNPAQNFLIQEYIWEKAWQDIRLFVVGWKVVASMLRKWQEWDFKSNYSTGWSVSAHVASEIEELIASQAANVIWLDIAWIDLLFDKNNGYKICEVNASPGFKWLEEASGVDIAAEIISYIKNRYLL